MLIKPDDDLGQGLSIREARLIGDLLGQKDAGIEMLSIKLETTDQGKTIKAEFRTPLGIFAFSDCDVTLGRGMGALVDLKSDQGGPRMAKEKLINADRYAAPTRKIRFEE